MRSLPTVGVDLISDVRIIVYKFYLWVRRNKRSSGVHVGGLPNKTKRERYQKEVAPTRRGKE